MSTLFQLEHLFLHANTSIEERIQASRCQNPGYIYYSSDSESLATPLTPSPVEQGEPGGVCEFARTGVSGGAGWMVPFLRLFVCAASRVYERV